MATGITVTMLCPGPTFSNLLAGAATENAGEVKLSLFSASQFVLEYKVLELSSERKAAKFVYFQNAYTQLSPGIFGLFCLLLKSSARPPEHPVQNL